MPRRLADKEASPSPASARPGKHRLTVSSALHWHVSRHRDAARCLPSSPSCFSTLSPRVWERIDAPLLSLRRLSTRSQGTSASAAGTSACSLRPPPQLGSRQVKVNQNISHGGVRHGHTSLPWPRVGQGITVLARIRWPLGVRTFKRAGTCRCRPDIEHDGLHRRIGTKAVSKICRADPGHSREDGRLKFPYRPGPSEGFALKATSEYPSFNKCRQKT